MKSTDQISAHFTMLWQKGSSNISIKHHCGKLSFCCELSKYFISQRIHWLASMFNCNLFNNETYFSLLRNMLHLLFFLLMDFSKLFLPGDNIEQSINYIYSPMLRIRIPHPNSAIANYSVKQDIVKYILKLENYTLLHSMVPLPTSLPI